MTEATLAQVTWTRNNVLALLQQLGVKIAIDDFGAEYSSFDYLRAYRVNHVKIAQPFILQATDDASRVATIRAIIGLARELGIVVIAEGVETGDQRSMLRATGSTEAQGYYFSAAVDAAKARRLLGAGTLLPDDSVSAADAPITAAATRRRRDSKLVF